MALRPTTGSQEGRASVRAAALAGAVALAAAACQLGALDLVGKKCSQDRPCGDGFACWEGACVSLEGIQDLDAGLPYWTNLVTNPGFELLDNTGSLLGWRTVQGKAVPWQPAYGGNFATKVHATTKTGQNPLLYQQEPVAGTSEGDVYCAKAWLRTDLDETFKIGMTVRDLYPDAGLHSFVRVDTVVTSAQWTESKASIPVAGDGLIDVRFQSLKNLDAGEGYLVDDVQLYRVRAADDCRN